VLSQYCSAWLLVGKKRDYALTNQSIIEKTYYQAA
jgi:hypothetical protein